MKQIICLSALVFLFGWGAIGLSAGHWQWPDFNDPIIAELRFNRVLTALLVGASLSASGAALQALFRNPLADPGLIGTSSGSALGVILLIAFGFQGIALPFVAFIGGLLITFAVLGLNHLVKGGQVGLLLIGIVVSSFCGAIISLILFLSDDLALRGAMTWLSGNLSDSSYGILSQASIIMGVGGILLLSQARYLDALMLGDDTARSLGIKIERTQTLTAIATALLVGAAVSLSGIIGFIGMMIPNALSLIIGGYRRHLIVLSALTGALFLLCIDTLAREVAYPLDLPAGLLAAFAGPPFFLWLLLKRQTGTR